MAKYLFDTCSLIALVRYYIPFDLSGELKDFILKGFKSKEFIILKQVKNECKQVGKGLVFQKLPQLKSIKHAPFDATPTADIHNLIDEMFIVPLKRKQIADSNYESQKSNFINSADFNLIYCAMQNHYIIITEESATNNDNKLFKKIPLICQEQKIKCITLPDLLKERVDISFSIKTQKQPKQQSLFY